VSCEYGLLSVFVPVCFLEMCPGSGLGLSVAGVVAVVFSFCSFVLFSEGSRVSVPCCAYLCCVGGFLLLILC
jgi:hypothetical protein